MFQEMCENIGQSTIYNKSHSLIFCLCHKREAPYTGKARYTSAIVASIATN